MAAAVVGALLSACQSGGGSGTSSAAGASASSTPRPSSASPAELPGGCTENAPCRFDAGTYSLGMRSVLPGMTLTLPAGWSSLENDEGELSLVPPGQPDDRLFVWIDLVAVKSTGPGHGTTVLTKVKPTPEGLIGWLTSNPDFTIVAKPAATTIAGNPMRTVMLAVSRSAQFGDPECPANPRCAALFTKPGLWGKNFYAIGGEGEAWLSFGTIRTKATSHTLILGLDALNHADLAKLAAAARPILQSIQLPTS
jgi:hypothetical protein